MFSRSRRALNWATASLTGAKKTLSNITPLVFSRESMPYIGGGLVLSGISSGLNLLYPLIYSKAVDMLNTKEPVTFAGISMSPLVIVGMCGTVYMLNNLVSTARHMVFTPLGPIASQKLVLRFVESQVNQSYVHSISIPEGIHNKMIGYCYTAPLNWTTNLFSQIIPTSADVLIASCFLWHLFGPKIGLSLIGITSASVGFNVLTKNLITQLRSEMLKHGFKAYEEMVATLAKYLTMHTFGKKEYELARLRDYVAASANADIKGTVAIPKIGLGQVAISGAGFIALSMVIAQGVLTGEYKPSDFVLVTGYLTQFSLPLAMLCTAVTAAAASSVEINKVYDEINMPCEVVDTFAGTLLVADRHNAKITLDNVFFEYEVKSEEEKAESKKTIVLDGVSLVIEPGKKVAFVGSSGAGKTTLAMLLQRFVEPTKGRILIGGQDIKEVGLSSLRSKISIIPQTPVLFSDTIGKNIAYGSAKENVEEKEIFAAVQAASLTSTIAKLPKGLDTLVGERGAKLSGGQRQRVAIARALMKDPLLLILDEATSALDATTEEEVQKSIEQIINDKNITSIFITHRLRTLENIDVIFVLDNGKIVDKGTHQELIARPGIYLELWKKQSTSTLEVGEDMESEEVKPEPVKQDVMSIEKVRTSLSRLSLFAQDERKEVRIDIASPAPL